MQTVICDKCGEDAECLRKERLIKETAGPSVPPHATIGWRFYLECPKCGNLIQEQLHNPYLDTPSGYN